MPISYASYAGFVELHDAIALANTIRDEEEKKLRVAERQEQLFDLLNTELQNIFAEGTNEQIAEILGFIHADLTNEQKYQLLVGPYSTSLGRIEYQNNALMLCATHCPELIGLILDIEIVDKPDYLERMLSQQQHPHGKNVFAILLRSIGLLGSIAPRKMDLDPVIKLLESINQLAPATKRAIFLQVINEGKAINENSLMFLLHFIADFNDRKRRDEKSELVDQILVMFAGDDAEAKASLYQLLHHQNSFGQTALLLSFDCGSASLDIIAAITAAIESLGPEQGAEIINLANQEGSTAIIKAEAKLKDYPVLRDQIKKITSHQDNYYHLATSVDDEDANRLMQAIKKNDLEDIQFVLAEMAELATEEDKMKIFCQKFWLNKHKRDSREICNALYLACVQKYYEAVPLLLNFMASHLSEDQQFNILRSLRTRQYDSLLSRNVILDKRAESHQGMQRILETIFKLPTDLLVRFFVDYKLEDNDKNNDIFLKLLKKILQIKSDYAKIIYQLTHQIINNYGYSKSRCLFSEEGDEDFRDLVAILIHEATELSEQEQADFLDDHTLSRALEQRSNPKTILQILQMMKCCKTEPKKIMQLRMLYIKDIGRNTLKEVCDNRDTYEEAILPMLALIAQLPDEQQQNLLSEPSRSLVAAGRLPIIPQQEILKLIKKNPAENARYLLDLAHLEVPNKGAWLRSLLLLAAQHDPNSVTPMLETIPNEEEKYLFFLENSGALLEKLDRTSAEGLPEMIERFITNTAINKLEDYLDNYPNKGKQDYIERQTHFDGYLKPLIDKFNTSPRETISEQDLGKARVELGKFKKTASLSNKYWDYATQLLDLLNLYHTQTPSSDDEKSKSIAPAPQPEDYRLGPFAPEAIAVGGSYTSFYVAPSAPPLPSYAEASLEEKQSANPLSQSGSTPVATATEVTHQYSMSEDDDVLEPPLPHHAPSSPPRDGRSPSTESKS